MDYKKHYDLLIKRAKTRQLSCYIERHHIVPKCMGGTDDKSNLVELTPEEHYVAHQLLVKMYPNVDGLVYAASKMTVSSKTVLRNNKLYGWLKRRYQSVCKKRVGEKNSSYGNRWYTNFILKKCVKVNPTDFKYYESNGYVKQRVLDFSLYDDHGNKNKEDKEYHPSSFRKLLKDQVMDIFYSDKSQNKLSKLYNVDRSTIRNIKNKKNYTDITKDLAG
jgi:hypothetical protein